MTDFIRFDGGASACRVVNDDSLSLGSIFSRLFIKVAFLSIEDRSDILRLSRASSLNPEPNSSCYSFEFEEVLGRF